MQNLSNYSNAAPQQRLNPQLASIEHLQKYITELTLYINENNHKYNKNMQTLKEFYDEQVDNLQGEKDRRDEEILALRN
jgi:esterase/lipase